MATLDPRLEQPMIGLGRSVEHVDESSDSLGQRRRWPAFSLWIVGLSIMVLGAGSLLAFLGVAAVIVGSGLFLLTEGDHFTLPDDPNRRIDRP